MCKKNIEEEEAAAEAKVRSMLPQDMPHPSLSGMPLPTSDHKVLIHIQRNRLDGNNKEVRVVRTSSTYVCPYDSSLSPSFLSRVLMVYMPPT